MHTYVHVETFNHNTQSGINYIYVTVYVWYFYTNIKNAYSYISVHYIDTINSDGVPLNNNGFSNGASNGSSVKGKI